MEIKKKKRAEEEEEEDKDRKKEKKMKTFLSFFLPYPYKVPRNIKLLLLPSPCPSYVRS